MHSVIQIWTFLRTVNAWGLAVEWDGFVLSPKTGFSAYLRPLAQTNQYFLHEESVIIFPPFSIDPKQQETVLCDVAKTG